MSTGPSGVSSCVSNGPKFPYGLGFSPALSGGTSTFAMLMRIVALSISGGVAVCSRTAASRLQSQGMGDDLSCLVRQSKRPQCRRICQDDITGIGPAAQDAAASVTQVVDQHEVVLHGALVVAHDAVEHLDHGSDGDNESGLLEHFPCAGLLQCLPDFHAAAGQVPLPFQGFVRALHEYD